VLKSYGSGACSFTLRLLFHTQTSNDTRARCVHYSAVPVLQIVPLTGEPGLVPGDR